MRLQDWSKRSPWSVLTGMRNEEHALLDCYQESDANVSKQWQTCALPDGAPQPRVLRAPRLRSCSGLSRTRCCLPQELHLLSPHDPLGCVHRGTLPQLHDRDVTRCVGELISRDQTLGFSGHMGRRHHGMLPAVHE